MHISRFPPEVLMTVLRNCVGSFADNKESYVANMDTVRLVCHSWDDIIIGDVLLWTFVYVNQYTSFDTLRLRLQRAGEILQLTFVISFFWGRGPGPFEAALCHSVVPASTVAFAPTFVNNLFDIIAPMFHRCRYFELFTEDLEATRLFMQQLRLLDASSLVYAYLHVCPTPLPIQRASVEDEAQSGVMAGVLFGGVVPRLTTLHFQRCYFLGTDYQFCRNLLDLRLQNLWQPYALKFSELFALLSVTRLLRRLHLWFVSCSDFDNCATPPPTLPHLTHLAFGPMSVASCPVLDRISMPQLRTLILHVNSPSTVDPARRFCVQSFKKVTSVILSADRVSTGDVVSLMSMWPHIRRLDARASTSNVMDALKLIAVDTAVSFPSLISIALPRRDGSDDDGLTAVLLLSKVFGDGLRVVRDTPPFGGRAIQSWVVGPNRDDFASETTCLVYDFFEDGTVA
jgi:hypothetical protein